MALDRFTHRIPNLTGDAAKDIENLRTALFDIMRVRDTFNGQLKFPATQNSSSNANTLDDYEEGTWTPVLTFATPGNLSVVYSSQAGSYTKIGRLVTVSGVVATSTFTHTTASGLLEITGLPFTAANVTDVTQGAMSFQGLTFGTAGAGYTQVTARPGANTTIVVFDASGPSKTRVQLVAGDTTSGTQVVLCITATYRV